MRERGGLGGVTCSGSTSFEWSIYYAVVMIYARITGRTESIKSQIYGLRIDHYKLLSRVKWLCQERAL